ncbi:MAG: hypothetical protein IBJ10_10745 [Phycisphaerales bacterium]|nr:hypothetical protein [Phycisphaerales bacterium]
MKTLAQIGVVGGLLVASAGAARTASGAAFALNWMSLAPTPYGSSVPNNSVFFLPGAGTVTLSYSFSGFFQDGRLHNAFLDNGTITNGADTYSWGHSEFFDALHLGPVPSGPAPWSITFTFSNTQGAGDIYLGVAGLGQTTDNGGGATTATVFQSGMFMGEWSGGANYGANQFSGGSGSFQLQNSATGIGGSNPWWNSQLAVVRIDDVISSLTVHFSQLNGDGVIVNIAAVPTPGSAALLGGAALLGVKRRRR